MDKYFWIYYLMCILWCITFIGMILYLYVNSSRPYEAKFKEKFYKKIPSNLNPGELSFLMYKKITPEVFTATVFILIKKGVLTLKKHSGDMIITLNETDSRLSPSQKLVCNILINDIGDGSQVTFKQIETYSKSAFNCSEFLMNYQIWSKMMVKESNKKSFYEPKTEYNQVKSMRNLGIFLFLLNIILGYNSLLGYFIIVPSFFIVLYFFKIYKRTNEANEEYFKWLAFKRYLENINNFEYKKEDIGTYLIYGLILKIPDLEQKITDFYCIEKLNYLISHTVIISNLRGSRSIHF